MRKGLLVLVIISLTAFLMGGCAAKDEKVTHEDIKGKKITISTGDFEEACDKWKVGDTVNYSFKSSLPVMFNIHYHDKMRKVYPVEKTLVDSMEGSFVVKTTDVHCCMWENKNPKYVTVTYEMSIEKAEK